MLSTLHLFTVFPIIAYVIRIQIFGTFFGNPYPSRKHMIVYALFIFGSSFLVLILAYNKLGVLLGIVGATFGFILVYFIPIIINLIYYRRKHPSQEVLKDLEEQLNEKEHIDNSLKTIHESNLIESNNKGYVLSPSKFKNDERVDIKDQYIITGKERNQFKDYFFYFTQWIMMGIGLITMIFQFITVNIFEITITNN